MNDVPLSPRESAVYAELGKGDPLTLGQIAIAIGVGCLVAADAINELELRVLIDSRCVDGELEYYRLDRE